MEGGVLLRDRLWSAHELWAEQPRAVTPEEHHLPSAWRAVRPGWMDERGES